MKDTTTLELLQRRDTKVFKEVFLKFYPPLCEYASQFIRENEAEELVQDFMLYIWENCESLVITQSLESYLFVAVKNRCLNAIKKNQYHQQAYSRIYELLKDELDDPNYYLANELAERIEIAINNLPETYRETFKMSRQKEMTNTQVAKALGVSVKTVEYRISQSLKILRHELREYLPMSVLLLLRFFLLK